MTDTATSRVRSAAQGYVELAGRSAWLDGPPIVSPLTGYRCAWWCYTIERKQGKNWQTEVARTSDNLFLLDDGTDRCVIDPEGAKVTPTHKRTWYGRGLQPDRGPEAGGGVLGALFGGPYRYTERLIDLGGPLYALGEFRTQRHGEADTETEVRELLAEWKADQKTLHDRFDVDGDGHIDSREWEAARRVARMQVQRAQNERATEPGLHVMAEPDDGRAFLLAGVAQSSLKWHYQRNAALYFLAFLFGAGLLAWFVESSGWL